MKKKTKTAIIIGLILLITLTFGGGITYSMLHSRIIGSMNNQKVASFIFNAEAVQTIDLPLIDLKPGDIKTYNFDVSNTENTNRSEVTIEYRMTIKTYHIVPLIIELYDSNNNLLIACDESKTRGDNNELICNSSVITMSHDNDELDSYQLKVSFPSEFNDAIYADLVDYINIEISSWQKISG